MNGIQQIFLQRGIHKSAYFQLFIRCLYAQDTWIKQSFPDNAYDSCNADKMMFTCLQINSEYRQSVAKRF